jgi:hypothetical protein
MPNPKQPGNPTRPNSDDQKKPGQPGYQPVEQDADAEIEEAQREDEEESNPRIDEPGEDRKEQRVQVSGEDQETDEYGDEIRAGEGTETDEDDREPLDGGDADVYNRPKRDGERPRP